MGGIFISYRRTDSDVAAGRLADDLSRAFGPGVIFRDIEALEPGENYERALDRALDSCVALVAVIGPNWLTIADRGGKPRLADPHDWVRTEIRKALERRIPVVPILLSGTAMPQKVQMPEDLGELPMHQAFELDDRHWKEELKLLVAALEKIPGITKRPDAASLAVYRPLVADLENLERAWSALARIGPPGGPRPEKSFVLAQLHMVEVAAAAVCGARKDVSALDDRDTRKELDAICTAVELMKTLGEHSEFGEGAIALARVFEEDGRVKRLREGLLSRV